MDRLSKTDRAVAMAEAGHTSAEIAEALGTTPNTVRVLIWRRRNPDGHKAAAKLDRERYPQRQREANQRWRDRLSDEQRAEMYYRRKCREAGVSPG